MSKLDVKSHKSKHKFAHQPSIESIGKIIEEGRRINYLRCLQEPAVDTCNCMSEKGEFPKKFYICKILWPHERVRKYPECDHANDIVPDRDAFQTQQKYMKFLATPKKRPPPPPMPRWIRRNIPAATVHVHKLAQPRHRTLIETFKQNCSHFSIFQIETIADKIYREQFCTPQQAINEMKQNLRNHQKRVRQQKNEIKKLQKKIENCNEFNTLAEKLTRIFREFMLKEQSIDECPELEHLTAFINNYLSKMFKSPRADEKSSIIDEVVANISNKFTSCMCDVLKNTEEPTAHDVDDCLKNLSLPTDGNYLRKDGSNASDMSGSSTEDFLSVDSTLSQFIDVEGIKKIDKDLLSLLSMSKIKITREECAVLTANMNKIKDAISSGAMKAGASQKSVKHVPKDGEVPMVRKKKKPKKKKGKKKNEKCFGKRDIKPQWAIEWREKTDGGACSTSENKS